MMKSIMKKAEEKIDIHQYIALEEELSAVKEQYGIKKEGKISRLISHFFDYCDNREKQLLNRKKYLLLAAFTGWIGGHRFYAKQYKTAILYLLFFWTGFPIAMTIIDFMIAIPKEVDRDGNISI